MPPRKLNPSQCLCGCGEITKTGDFRPGHDQKLRSAIEGAVGGLLNLRSIAEKHVGYRITAGAMPQQTEQPEGNTMPMKDKKVCPECGHVFKGDGYDGIDAHWKAKHEHIMPYSEAWPLIKAGLYDKAR